MSRGPDVATRLARALVQAAVAAKVDAVVTAADWRRWASVTFTGARHRLTLEASAGAALDRWLAALPEHEFALSGHIVADLAVAGMRRGEDRTEIDLEVLTVEES